MESQAWRGWRSSPHYCIHIRRVEHGRRFRGCDWGNDFSIDFRLEIVRCRLSIGVKKYGGEEEVIMAVEVKSL
jgi:hypothetical protein